MDRWKAEQGRGREKRKIRGEKSRRERVRRKKIQMREKVGKSRFTVFFQWFVAPGSKSRLAKRRVRSQLKHSSKSKCTKHTIVGPLLAVAMSKKCTPLWREAHFEVKMYKTHQGRSTFGSWDVEKVHAVVVRSTFRSQNVQSTPFSDHFWQLRCRKSARRCGAKHISKSKCTKHHMFAPLLEVQKSFRVAGARDCGPCQKWAKREGFVEFSTTTTTTLHHSPISLISKQGFFDEVFFKWFWILENPGKILSKSFMSLSWSCFALVLIFVSTPCCFQWVHCMTSFSTRWNLEQQPPGVTGENWEKVSFF